MAQAQRWLGVGLMGLGVWFANGCASLPDWAMPEHSYALDLRTEPEPRIARLQTADTPLPKPPQGISFPPDTPLPKAPTPQGIGLPVIGLPTPAPIARPPLFGEPAPLPSPPGAVQTSLTTRGTVRISIRAWINGKPIFDDEVMQAVGSDLRRIQTLPEPQRSQKLAESINSHLDQIIDGEVMYQEAMKRIEKSQPHMITKLKQVVDEEYYKQVDRMRKANVPENYIKELEATSKRMLERNLISTEYARSRIMEGMKVHFNFWDVKDYYQAHLTEFRTVDKVVWQDIFIPVGPNLPRVEDAQRFAEDLISKCRRNEDFNRLMVYNEGDSKLRNGEGLGQRRGEIRPSELETVLFNLREGEVGPVVPFHTGVHLVRVLKREYAAQTPLDDATQTSIKKKLENELADREFKRIVRELRSRAVITILRSAPGER